MATAIVNYHDPRRVLSVVYRVCEVYTVGEAVSDPIPTGLGLWTTEPEAADAATVYGASEAGRGRTLIVESLVRPILPV